MTPGFVVLLLLALMMGLILLGFHIGVVLGVTSALGVYLLLGGWDAALSILSTTAYEAIRADVFAVIPLFVLMGDVVSKCGAARDLYHVCDRAFRRLPGRLAIATVAGNAIFAAVTGVSIAAAASFSRFAYPEMRRLHYSRPYALGVVAGSAVLGMLIPPSILLIVWAILTEQSVGALFIAGVIPGMLLAFLFAVYCIWKARSDKTAAPQAMIDETVIPGDRRSELLGALGVVGLIALSIGGLWFGLFTPTEAAGFGALGSLVLAWFKGMRWRELMQAIYDAGRTTAPIMFLLITASMYSRFLAMGGAVNTITDLTTSLGLSPWGLILLLAVIWIILGCLIDSVSIILLTVPIFAPLATAAGFDPLAFAIFGILVIEAGLLTPPFGLLIFTVKSAVPDPDVQLGEIFRGAFPYCVLIILVAFIVIALPQLANVLPRLML